MSYDADGARFLIAFNSLKALVEDDPTRLEMEMDDGSPVAALCAEIYQLVNDFEKIERASSDTFTENVSAASVKARREYDELWRHFIWYAIYGLDNDLFHVNWNDYISHKKMNGPVDQTGVLIEVTKNSANINDEFLQESLEKIQMYVDEDCEEDYYVDLDIGIRALNSLIGDLDAADVFWKRDMLPHVLIPEHVAKRYGRANPSLYRRLHEAGRAFTYGAPLAALAMQRAILEEVLTKHWGALKTDRGYRIEDAKLPQLAWESRASRLKRLGNEALHHDPDHLSPDELDRTIIENFLLLRALIENAPTLPQAGEGGRP